MSTQDVEQYRQTIEKGTILLREGEVDTRFFLLQEGVLDIFIKGKKINTVDTQNGQDFIGEIGAVLGTPRSATVVAATTCIVLCLPKIEIEAVIRKSPALGVRLIHSLCQKLANSASIVAEYQTGQAPILGSGDTELSLKNYAKGVLHLMERAMDQPSPETVERLHTYFLQTNPWCIRHGDSDLILDG
ncbi:MAG: cyclic nucleotide-binding domain-containing protein [Deltaproteobacteria bacterium]|nr:cyclic nucleotide-binding domain-containing protein [Deltaproteobacteria bacterium]